MIKYLLAFLSQPIAGRIDVEKFFGISKNRVQLQIYAVVTYAKNTQKLNLDKSKY